LLSSIRLHPSAHHWQLFEEKWKRQKYKYITKSNHMKIREKEEWGKINHYPAGFLVKY
jgi:hypothetical protein